MIARIKAATAPKAMNIPGGLSLIPIIIADAAKTMPIAKKMIETVRFRGVDRAAIISIFPFIYQIIRLREVPVVTKKQVLLIP